MDARGGSPEPANALRTPSVPQDKPVIRIIHHLARSGGTLMSRCLGCMQGVTLLSEIHPRIALNDRATALAQARDWFRLVRPDEVARLRKSRDGFQASIELIAERAAAKRAPLVIRDWSHIDYHGVPYVRTPAQEPALIRSLESAFEVRSVSTVRHPIDQWLSLRRLTVMQGAITLGQYLTGCRRFAEFAAETGFVRYEDFTKDPDQALATLTRQIDVEMDPDWAEKWGSYTKITGAVSGSRGKEQIRPLPRQSHEADLEGRFAASDDYQRTIELLGYDHPV